MKGSAILLLVGLIVTALVTAPALLPAKVVENERFRLDPTTPNYGDGTGGGGYAIGLPDMESGDRVRVTWDLQRTYVLRVLPSDGSTRAPYVTDAAPLVEQNATAEGEFNFTSAENASYWLTFTVPKDEKLEKGTVRLHWEPPLQRDPNPLFLDMGFTFLVITLVSAGAMEWALRRRDRERAKGHSHE